ncbi:nitroreductase [Bacillus sp. FJAT-18017]|uniref:nitroreductase family protein n=1 Tax=Bacillus sp. FJAT-18017 TaxID=1705566 RepID=UPI0006AE1B4A|nr:nitroreductase family protein [Bacillus sp. FJAT-18017]ALC91826.1 nitroreductase [Bacillus sp. FJAT-18017]
MQDSVIEIMQKRQSIRTFSTDSMEEQHIQSILEYIGSERNFTGPFWKTGRAEFVGVSNNVTDKGFKVGTYGFIKNPSAYLVGICKNEKDDLIDFGYCFHKLVIHVGGLGMGTCWMGGTFSRNSFEKELSISSEEFIPCVTPIGYPKEKQRLFDKAVRAVVKADNKKPWDKLFYDGDLKTPLVRETAGLLETPIEMVRLGPSASNKQPWRIAVSEDRKTCHFYIEHTPNYSTSLGYDMQLLDIGIAMCQFELACKELKINGKWVKEQPGFDVPNGQTEYIVSWKTSK